MQNDVVAKNEELAMLLLALAIKNLETCLVAKWLTVRYDCKNDHLISCLNKIFSGLQNPKRQFQSF